MLRDVLAKEDIMILESVSDWREAIYICLQPLIKKECVDVQYGDAVIKNVEKYGKNFMISPYIVLPHARPEQGVNENSISVLLLKKPCSFGNSKMPIKLLIIMASKDSKSHLQILQSISKVLNDEKCMKTIVNSSTKEELYMKFVCE